MSWRHMKHRIYQRDGEKYVVPEYDDGFVFVPIDDFDQMLHRLGWRRAGHLYASDMNTEPRDVPRPPPPSDLPNPGYPGTAASRLTGVARYLAGLDR